MSRASDIGRVWLAFSGDYEQRAPFAAFTTEKLARGESDDVEEVPVFDRPIKTARKFCYWVTVFPGGAAVDTHGHHARVEQRWSECAGESWNEPIAQADVVGPYKHLGGAMWVIVEGADEASCEEEWLRTSESN